MLFLCQKLHRYFCYMTDKIFPVTVTDPLGDICSRTLPKVEMLEPPLLRFRDGCEVLR